MELNALKIELIDQKTVKITLNEADLDEMALSFHADGNASLKTKQAVWDLIAKIKEETALDLTGGKLFVEAFPDANGGCVLYVNVIEQRSSAPKAARDPAGLNTPILFRFPSLADLTEACARLFRQYSHLVRKSSLYLLGQDYYFVLYSYLRTDEKLIRFLNEYGRYAGKGAVRLSYLREHARCLIEDAALEILVDSVC